MDKSMQVAVKSADRVLDVFELLSGRGKALSHTDISTALGIPKSSLTQLLRNLTARGYLRFSAGPNTYELGRSFFDLLRRGRESRDIVAIARPILEKLTAATNESSSFNIYRADHVERMCGVDSPQGLIYRMTVGACYPLYSSSGGKAVLAGLPEEERERYLGRVRIDRRTDSTIRSVPDLRRELAKVTRDGVAYSRGEHTPGIVAIAAAVRRLDGTPIGALTVVTPSVRLNSALQKLCVRSLKAAAIALERELRARFPPDKAGAKADHSD